MTQRKSREFYLSNVGGNGPSRRHVDIRPIKGGNRRAAQQSQRALDIRPQNFQRARNSRWPSSRESVGVSSPNKNGTRSEAERFHNVTAAANSTIHEHLDLAFHGHHHFGERAQRGRNRIELTATVVRYNYGSGTFVRGPPGVVARQKAFNHDRSRPQFADPTQVFPGHGGARQGSADVEQFHRTFTWDDNVLQLRHSAVEQKRRQPTRMSENVGQVRNFRGPRTAQEFFHPIPRIALSQSGHRRVHGNNQGRKSCATSPVERTFRRRASAEQIQLIPDWTLRSSFHVLQFVGRNRRQDVPGTCFPSRMSRCQFTGRVHQTAVSDWRQYGRERKLMAEHPSLQSAIADSHGTARTKQDIVEYPAVFP